MTHAALCDAVLQGKAELAPAASTAACGGHKGAFELVHEQLRGTLCEATLGNAWICVRCIEPWPEAKRRCRQIGREFRGRLSAAHDSGCPWKAAACDPSLAQFPPQDRAVVAAGFAARSAAVGRLNALPPISQDAYARVNALRRSPIFTSPSSRQETLEARPTSTANNCNRPEGLNPSDLCA